MPFLPKLEIGAPVPIGGDVVAAFSRCVAEVNAAIVRSPAQWRYCASTADLVDLGLITPADHQPETASSALAATGVR